jgi:hypothetical protein
MKTARTIEVPGATLEIIPRRLQGITRDRDYTKAPRMYVSMSAAGETVLDNLLNRKRRPYNIYKTLIHSSGIGSVLDLSKLSWSQHAGCSCPCSPGFVLNRQYPEIEGDVYAYFDVWVTLHGAPSVDERKAPRVLVGA